MGERQGILPCPCGKGEVDIRNVPPGELNSGADLCLPCSSGEHLSCVRGSEVVFHLSGEILPCLPECGGTVDTTGVAEQLVGEGVCLRCSSGHAAWVWRGKVQSAVGPESERFVNVWQL